VSKPRYVERISVHDIEILPGGRLHPAHAAAYIGRHPEVLRKWRQQGKGPPFHRLPGYERGGIYYLKRDLDQWMKASKVTHPLPG